MTVQRTGMTNEDPARTSPAPEGPWAKSARMFLGATMVGLGVLGLIHGDFALVWQRIPIAHLPGRTAIAYLCAAIELGTGLGLFARRTAGIASLVLFPYLLLWAILLKLPAVIAVPQMEATWLGFGQIAVLAAGGWTVWITEAGPGARSRAPRLTGASGLRAARVLFAVSLPMIGLSHFVYSQQTADFVPKWLPFPFGWAYLTGAGSLAAALGLACGVWPRLAATLEAGMLAVITLLVWGLGVLGAPTVRVQWTGFFISAAITGGAWAVAASYRDTPWLEVGRAARAVPRGVEGAENARSAA